MNVFVKFDEIPSIILKVIRETKCYGHTHAWKDGQRENSIPTHKHSLGGDNYNKRSNGPVNVHLISWSSKAQNIQNLEN